MVSGILTLGLLACAVFATPLIPAIIARRKEHPFLLYYLFGFLCIIPAVIIAARLNDRTTSDYTSILARSDRT